MGGMGNILEQARTMQDRLQAMQEEVGARTVEGTAGGGMVRVEVSGKLEIRRITIEDSVYADDDREMLQDLVAAGVNDAIRKAQKMMADEMTQLTGGISLPG
ncbi:MAG TPA: YbaB/EbfC family nucleoid-associated protein, partial [Deltaproteobacteria bacterium]|nr:YbaB/EbfC family nucleoid-associated protein [Deltaproteobacteria bacterium]